MNEGMPVKAMRKAMKAVVATRRVPGVMGFSLKDFWVLWLDRMKRIEQKYICEFQRQDRRCSKRRKSRIRAALSTAERHVIDKDPDPDKSKREAVAKP